MQKVNSEICFFLCNSAESIPIPLVEGEEVRRIPLCAERKPWLKKHILYIFKKWNNASGTIENH